MDKAEKVMRKVAKVNGKNLPENVFTDEEEVEMEEKVSLKSCRTFIHVYKDLRKNHAKSHPVF